MIEKLETIKPYQFLKGACINEVGKTLFLAPEFLPQMVNIAAGIAGGKKNPCPFINTYGTEEAILPKYVADTIKIMIDNKWIESIVLLGFTDTAIKQLKGELKSVKVDVKIIDDTPTINGYAFDKLADWMVRILKDFYCNTSQMILAYHEPLSAFLSAKLKAPILPLKHEIDALPKKYLKIINDFEVEKIILIIHSKYVEESWKTNRIIQELKSISNIESIIIYGDMFQLSKYINETAYDSDGCMNKTCFVSGVNEIPILTPLAIVTDALILRCGFDNFNLRFKSLFKKWNVKRAVITESPDQLFGEEVDTWFHISSGTRQAIEAIINPTDVYRLWFNQPKKVILKLMNKYNSLDTMAHVLYWGVEREMVETMFRISKLV